MSETTVTDRDAYRRERAAWWHAEALACWLLGLYDISDDCLENALAWEYGGEVCWREARPCSA